MSSSFPVSVDDVVLGAGISGLATAYFLKNQGHSVALLENSERSGGVIRSEWKEGFLLEYGPNTVLPNAELMELVQGLKLENEVLLANPKATRYVQWQGQLHSVPTSPTDIFKTKLLSRHGRLRLAAEPFAAKRKDPTEESLYDFSRRRLGVEATERLLAPFVSGVWAGDVNQLSAEAAFPKLVQAEREKGSLLRGLLSARKKNGMGKSSLKGLLSFKNGLEALTQALAKDLEGNLFLNTRVTGVERDQEQWKLNGENFSLSTRRVIFAQPAWDTADLVKPLSAPAAQALNEIPSASLTVLHLGIEQTAVNHALDGFGYLIAPTEGTEVLGCLWSSSLFPRRVPDGQALLTVFIGGARHPESVEKSEESLFDIVFQNLNPHLGFRKRPRILNLARYKRAIPQYNLGHRDRVRALKDFENQNSGLRFAGNYMSGISVGDVVRHAKGIVQ